MGSWGATVRSARRWQGAAVLPLSKPAIGAVSEGLRQMTVLFTADTHFGHAGALALYRRPFKSMTEMNAAIIERWNKAVRPQDEIWHLGDFAVRQRPARVAELLASLNGIKHLVTGNNDDEVICNDPAWRSVQAYCEIVLDGSHFVLCHYAFRTWRNMAQGWINLHGHSHGRLAPRPRQCDVGVDAWNFTPISTVEILERLRGGVGRTASQH